MRNAGLEETQAGIKIAGKNINNLRYSDDTTLMAESKEELKSLLMKVKEESETAGLKLNIQKTKITASGPITSWQTDEETMQTVIDFVFLGSKITADGDCSHEIRRCLLLGRKAMTNLDSILKSRDITLVTKVSCIKAMVFPVVMYGCENWTTEKAEPKELMLLCQGMFNFKKLYMSFSVPQGSSVSYQFLKSRNKQSCMPFSGLRSRDRTHMCIPFNNLLLFCKTT